jgi:adenylate cyclase
LKEHARVLELDPASAPAAHCYGQTLYFLRRYEEAEAQFRRALALDASFPRAHTGLGLVCVQQRQYQRGIEELGRARELSGGSGRVQSSLAYAYAMAGNRDKARQVLRELLSRFTPDASPALMIAEIYIGLRDLDRAFEWLHKAIDQHDLSAFLKCDPLYAPLRADARFSTLLKRTNLE